MPIIDSVIELLKISKNWATFQPFLRVDIRPNIRPNIRSETAEYSVSADTNFTRIGHSLDYIFPFWKMRENILYFDDKIINQQKRHTFLISLCENSRKIEYNVHVQHILVLHNSWKLLRAKLWTQQLLNCAKSREAFFMRVLTLLWPDVQWDAVTLSYVKHFFIANKW